MPHRRRVPAMLTLTLLRHAKSSRDDPTLDDFDRRLTPRGRDDAVLMRGWMAKHAITPDRVLSSPSERTRATCEVIFATLDRSPTLTFDEDLYLANPRVLVAKVHGVDDAVRHLMLVGHNPGLHALATAFIASGPEDLRAQLDDNLPTCGLVVLELNAARFADVKTGTARLVQFVAPKLLRA